MQKAAIDSKSFILILIVLFALVAMNKQGYLDGPKNTTLQVLSPIGSKFQFSSNSLDDLIYTIKKIGTFKSDNEKLQEENRNLNYELEQSEEIKRENEELKKQLKFKNNLCEGSDCIDFEIGRVISRGPDSYGRFIMIDVGKNDGAINGQAVTTAGGIMIGKVIEASDKYSKVMLLTSPESAVNCITQTTRANGLLRGKYGTGTKLEMISQNEDLTQGDLIITSGLESGIPKGLLLGKIANIEQSPNMVFKSADVELFSDFSHIEEVFLVKQK